jgi:hypothetical protein
MRFGCVYNKLNNPETTEVVTTNWGEEQLKLLLRTGRDSGLTGGDGDV